MRSPAVDSESLPALRPQSARSNARAEQAGRRMIVSTNIAQMFAALSATNEAILRATSEDELFQRVCDAAVFGGKLLGTGVLLAERGDRLRFVAGAGVGTETLRGNTSSTDEHSDEGQGLVASAFRSGR